MGIYQAQRLKDVLEGIENRPDCLPEDAILVEQTSGGGGGDTQSEFVVLKPEFPVSECFNDSGELEVKIGQAIGDSLENNPFVSQIGLLTVKRQGEQVEISYSPTEKKG